MSRLFATPWTAAHQASLSFPVTQSLLKLMSMESVMPSNRLILCCPLPSPPALNLCQYQGVGHPVHSVFLYHLPGQPDTRFHSCVHSSPFIPSASRILFQEEPSSAVTDPVRSSEKTSFNGPLSIHLQSTLTFVPLPVHFPLKFGWKSLNSELFKDPVCSFESKDL